MRMRIVRTAVGSMASWGFILELQKRGIEIIGTDSDPFPFCHPLLKKLYTVPTGDHRYFISEMEKICKKENPDAILSGPETELLSLSKNKKIFNEIGIEIICPEYKSVQICADKIRTYDFLRKINISVPSQFSGQEIEYPCLIKPRFGRGGQDVHIINNKCQMEHYIKTVQEPIIQEYLSGDEYSIDILADNEGNALSIVPRIRTKTESGISVKSTTVFDKELIDIAEVIVKELQLFGPSCLQCIKNDEGIKFLDLNTRFGGGSILSVMADNTIIPNLISIIKGNEPIKSDSFIEGLTMSRYYSEIFYIK